MKRRIPKALFKPEIARHYRDSNLLKQAIASQKPPAPSFYCKFSINAIWQIKIPSLMHWLSLQSTFIPNLSSKTAKISDLTVTPPHSNNQKSREMWKIHVIFHTPHNLYGNIHIFQVKKIIEIGKTIRKLNFLLSFYSSNFLSFSNYFMAEEAHKYKTLLDFTWIYI